MSVTLPNVPDAPGVPSVARTSLTLTQALNGLSSSSSQLSGLASLVSPEAANSVLSAATTINISIETLASAAMMVDQAKALSGIDRAAAQASAAGDVVALVDPVLGAQISGVAATVVNLAAVVRQIAPGNEQKLTSDSDNVKAAALDAWGIYNKDGSWAVWADSITAINYRQDYRIADYPIEQGGFESYNKIQTPKVMYVRMTKGGTEADRSFFLSEINKIKDTLDLYDILTPEATFSNFNVAGISIDRSQENGAGMIIADVQLQEVRQTVKLKFTKTKEPASAAPQSQGSVRPKAITGAKKPTALQSKTFTFDKNFGVTGGW